MSFHKGSSAPMHSLPLPVMMLQGSNMVPLNYRPYPVNYPVRYPVGYAPNIPPAPANMGKLLNGNRIEDTGTLLSAPPVETKAGVTVNTPAISNVVISERPPSAGYHLPTPLKTPSNGSSTNIVPLSKDLTKSPMTPLSKITADSKQKTKLPSVSQIEEFQIRKPNIILNSISEPNSESSQRNFLKEQSANVLQEEEAQELQMRKSKRGNTYLKINATQEKFFLSLCSQHHLKQISDTKQYSSTLNDILTKFVEEYPSFKNDHAKGYSGPLKRQLVSKLSLAVKKGREVDESMKLPESDFASYEFSRFSGLDLIYHSIWIDDQKRLQNFRADDNSINFNPPIFAETKLVQPNETARDNYDEHKDVLAVRRYRTDLAVKFKEALKKGYTIEEAAVEHVLREYGFKEDFVESYRFSKTPESTSSINDEFEK